MNLHTQTIELGGMKIRSGVLLLVAALIAAFTIGLDRGHAGAASLLVASPQPASVLVSLEPSSTQILPDQTFTMDVVVNSGAQEVTGVQAFLDFDPTKLQVEDSDPITPEVQVQRGSTLPAVPTNSADNTLGRIDYAAGDLTGPFPSGVFVLATVTFRAISHTPATDVTLSLQVPRDTYADHLGNPLPTDVSGATVVILSTADLAVNKSVSNSTPTKGETITYTITVANDGPESAINTVVNDTLPGGVTFVATSGCVEDPLGVPTCGLGNISAGTSVQYTIAVTIESSDLGTITNEATVSSDTEDPIPANNISSVSIDLQALAAEPSMTLHQDSSDGATGLKLGITRVFESASGSNVPVPASLGTYQAQLNYDGSCLNIQEVRGLDFNTTSIIDNPSGITTLSGSSSGGVMAPADLGQALTRLTGSLQETCSVTMEITILTDDDQNPINVIPPSQTRSFLRGDAQADGNINIADALFIAQYLVGLRNACTSVVDTTCLHSVNAASVHQDGDFDEKTIADALFIAQYLVGLRNESFNLEQGPLLE